MTETKKTTTVKKTVAKTAVKPIAKKTTTVKKAAVKDERAKVIPEVFKGLTNPKPNKVSNPPSWLAKNKVKSLMAIASEQEDKLLETSQEQNQTGEKAEMEIVEKKPTGPVIYKEEIEVSSKKHTAPVAGKISMKDLQANTQTTVQEEVVSTSADGKVNFLDLQKQAVGNQVSPDVKLLSKLKFK